MILLQSPKGYFIFFDYAVVFLAVIANIIVLSAVIGGRFGLSGYRRFLISLTVSDIYICLVNVLTFGYQIWMLCSATSSAEKCGANLLRALQLAGFFANLLNLCGMSVDHFVGIVYPMQYRYLMSKKVARLSVALIWVVSFSLAFLDFPVNMFLYNNFMASQQQIGSARMEMPSSMSVDTLDLLHRNPFPELSDFTTAYETTTKATSPLGIAALQTPLNFAMSAETLRHLETGGKLRVDMPNSGTPSKRKVMTTMETHLMELMDAFIVAPSLPTSTDFLIFTEAFRNSDADAKTRLDKPKTTQTKTMTASIISDTKSFEVTTSVSTRHRTRMPPIQDYDDPAEDALTPNNEATDKAKATKFVNTTAADVIDLTTFETPFAISYEGPNTLLAQHDTVIPTSTTQRIDVGSKVRVVKTKNSSITKKRKITSSKKNVLRAHQTSRKNFLRANKLVLSQKTTPPEDTPIFDEDLSKSASDLNLETADIEAFLESMINPNNPLDLNFFDNETNNSSPLNRILMVLQTENQNLDWCTFFSANKMWLEVCVMVLTLLCFVFLMICYGIIFKKVADSVDASGRSTHKLVVTTIMLLGAFCICWLPFMTFETAMLLIFQYDRDAKNHQTKSFLINFFFLHNMFNSLLMTYPFVDPIIYAVRVPAVQKFIIVTYGKYLPCFRNSVNQASSRRHSFVGVKDVTMPRIATGLLEASGEREAVRKSGMSVANNVATPSHSYVQAANHVRLESRSSSNTGNLNLKRNNSSTALLHRQKSLGCNLNHKSISTCAIKESELSDMEDVPRHPRQSPVAMGSIKLASQRLSLASSTEGNRSRTSQSQTLGKQNANPQSGKLTNKESLFLCLFCSSAQKSPADMKKPFHLKADKTEIGNSNSNNIREVEREVNASTVVLASSSKTQAAASPLKLDDFIEKSNEEVAVITTTTTTMMPVSQSSPENIAMIATENEAQCSINIIVFDEDDNESIAYTIDL